MKRLATFLLASAMMLLAVSCGKNSPKTKPTLSQRKNFNLFRVTNLDFVQLEAAASLTLNSTI